MSEDEKKAFDKEHRKTEEAGNRFEIDLDTYLDTGLVPRVPTAILITGLGIVAVLSFFAGLILDTVTRGRREMRRLAYLTYPAPTVTP